MTKCKITVLKRMVNQDLIDAFLGEEYKDRGLFPCQHFAEGQEFFTENWGVPPEEFCPSAWASIRGYIGVVITGGDLRPWVTQEGTAIACCTDGYRPVVFKIERVEEHVSR